MIAARRSARALEHEPNDAVVVAKIAQGDIAALGLLYDRHAAQLLRFAGRLTGSQDATDVVHSAFLRVLSLAHGYDTTFPSARPWLYGIVLRVIREHRRSLYRWASALTALSSQPAKGPASIFETRRDLDICLARLSLPKRTVLILSEVEGFTNDEIARMLDIPVGTVWTRLHHARRELRALYGGDEA